MNRALGHLDSKIINYTIIEAGKERGYSFDWNKFKFWCCRSWNGNLRISINNEKLELHESQEINTGDLASDTC
jgi:hypothetical protein